jgi:hypothetical protein
MMCPHCGERHRFGVLVRDKPESQAAVPLFGGGGAPTATTPPATPTIAFTCPVTRKIMNEKVPAPPGVEVIGPADSGPADSGPADSGPADSAPVDDEPAAAAAKPPATSTDAEYAEWIKSSRTTALDFCKTMLTASTGAIPVYFAVLKYLGTESASGSWFGRVAAIPPLLFLSAAIVAALALRPRFALVAPGDFGEFRAGRLRQLNRDLLIALTLFSGGVLIAILLGVAAW